MNPASLQPGYRTAGFETISNREMAEYSSWALRYRHIVTGCEVFHLWNEDPENLFAFTFRTPPQDNTGATHILEHSVLCGSKRFPLKDPFVVLLKSSLHTFLNAFTFPDKTVYPASSIVEKDFYNLMLVAGDAVFFPLLLPETFMQEAHHLELVEGGGPRFAAQSVPRHAVRVRVRRPSAGYPKADPQTASGVSWAFLSPQQLQDLSLREHPHAPNVEISRGEFSEKLPARRERFSDRRPTALEATAHLGKDLSCRRRKRSGSTGQELCHAELACDSRDGSGQAAFLRGAERAAGRK